jgi:autotransporter family porin
MAIRHKRKNSTGYTWQTGDLVEGQIGLNIADGTLHFDKADGSTVTIAPGGISELVQDTSPQLGGNLDVQANTITSSVLNGNITIVPNGTGDINLDADTVRVGDANAAATITTNGTGNLTLSTNAGTNSGTITINQGANSDIIITPNGTGDVDLIADTVQIGDHNTAATLTTNGTGNLILNTHNGTNSGSITIAQGNNGNITLAPNGSGDVQIDADTLRVGDSNIDAVITTNGTGNLVLSTNNGTNSGTIQINQGANSGIAITPNGTGDVVLQADTIRIGDNNATATITTFGTGDLVLNTGNGATTGLMQIVQGANANINITPNGTGGTVIKNLEYNEFVHDLGTTSGTITPNATNGNVQTITLNGNLTLSAFTSPVSGQTITFIITQDATGSRTLTSTMKFAGAAKTLSTAANSIDILTVSYIGTTYFATLSKGYA